MATAQIKSSGTFTLYSTNTVSYMNFDQSLNINKTGSNFITNQITISGSGYTPLPTQSLADIRYMYFSNEDTTGNLGIYLSGSNGYQPLTFLEPNDHSVIAFSGSSAANPIYVNITSGSRTELLFGVSER